MSNSNNLTCEETGYQKVITDLKSELNAVLNQPAAPQKKLSESRLKLAAMAALPTNVEADLTLKEAFVGTTRSFVIKDQIVCTECVNAKPINRLHCNGCKGLGYTLSERQVEINIDAGVTPGEEIRCEGLGAADIRSGKNGDLLVNVKINEHPYFKVEGKNITSTLAVSLYDATLGGKIEVPTANGKVMMTLAPLTKPGSIYRLKGLGIGGGDQLVTIEIKMPQMLTKEQVSLFQKIKEISDNLSPEGNLAYMN